MPISISLVIPAFNEARRLPPYLKTIRSYLSEQFAGDYEVIVVDDGSSDGLAEMVGETSREWSQLRALSHTHNRGKGAAVRTGMLAAQGRLLLFADADGATPIEEERRLRSAIDDGAEIAIGSRLLAAGDVSRQRTWTRAAVGRGFAQLARWALGLSIRDTQCGFKMFRGQIGRRLFGLSQEEGYYFDLELLILAERLGFRVVEVPINWADQPGSQLKMRQESGKIFRALWRLRRRRITLEGLTPEE